MPLKAKEFWKSNNLESSRFTFWLKIKFVLFRMEDTETEKHVVMGEPDLLWETLTKEGIEHISCGNCRGRSRSWLKFQNFKSYPTARYFLLWYLLELYMQNFLFLTQKFLLLTHCILFHIEITQLCVCTSILWSCINRICLRTICCVSNSLFFFFSFLFFLGL